MSVRKKRLTPFSCKKTFKLSIGSHYFSINQLVSTFWILIITSCVGKKKKKLVLKKRKKASAKPDTINEDENESLPSPTKHLVAGAMETKKPDHNNQSTDTPSTSKSSMG